MPTVTVPASKTRRRVLDLMERGWTRAAIAERAEISPRILTRITSQPAGRVAVTTHRAVLAIGVDEIARRPRADAMVPSRGTRRRFEALQALGWTHADIGTPDGDVGTTESVTQETADWIAEVYDRLAGTRGPSRKTRTQALNRGWATPRRWVDIDRDDAPLAEEAEDTYVDPVVVLRVTESAHHGVEIITPAERVEITRVMIGRGDTVRTVAERCGVDSRTIERVKYQHGIRQHLTRACQMEHHLSCTGYDAPPGEGSEEKRCTCTCHRDWS